MTNCVVKQSTRRGSRCANNNKVPKPALLALLESLGASTCRLSLREILLVLPNKYNNVEENSLWHHLVYCVDTILSKSKLLLSQMLISP